MFVQIFSICSSISVWLASPLERRNHQSVSSAGSRCQIREGFPHHSFACFSGYHDDAISLQRRQAGTKSTEESKYDIRFLLCQVSAKVLKDVKFTVALDLFDMCSEELKQKLMPAREKMKEAEDNELERQVGEESRLKSERSSNRCRNDSKVARQLRTMITRNAT